MHLIDTRLDESRRDCHHGLIFSAPCFARSGLEHTDKALSFGSCRSQRSCGRKSMESTIFVLSKTPLDGDHSHLAFDPEHLVEIACGNRNPLEACCFTPIESFLLCVCGNDPLPTQPHAAKIRRRGRTKQTSCIGSCSRLTVSSCSRSATHKAAPCSCSRRRIVVRHRPAAHEPPQIAPWHTVLGQGTLARAQLAREPPA